MKKFVTIPVALIIGLTFFPIAIGLLLMWFSHKKIRNSKIRLISLLLFGLLTLFFGVVWMAAMVSPSSSKTDGDSLEVQDINIQGVQDVSIDKPSPSPNIHNRSFSKYN